jgi:hypothetical protein
VTNLDLIPVLLLMFLSVALASGIAIVLLVLCFRRRHLALSPIAGDGNSNASCALSLRATFSHRPVSWLAVRSRNLQLVQSALGISNPRPCTWTEGLASEQKLFIAPPVKGFILITGSGLPEPDDDVDACFRFLLGLSRKLGQVQFFGANGALGHHAWVLAESGRIVRAYAWAGRTLWNQGVKTRAEIELGLKCFQYFDAPESAIFGKPDVIALNTDKVHLLAARWSIDPLTLDKRTFHQAHGIAGEPSRLY